MIWYKKRKEKEVRKWSDIRKENRRKYKMIWYKKRKEKEVQNDLI